MNPRGMALGKITNLSNPLVTCLVSGEWLACGAEGSAVETVRAAGRKSGATVLLHVLCPAKPLLFSPMIQCSSFVHVTKPKGLQWVVDVTIAYPKARPMDIQTWIFGYRPPTVTHLPLLLGTWGFGIRKLNSTASLWSGTETEAVGGNGSWRCFI
ncbi:hypothetical protein Z043_117029 [Scleropages formosus]|uniref:Uncharacterized protein n=1 Tax=Scleropages formosus TaxID=113540 RepID=A0A0P7UX05_SCLFO|nr:hypothetical protein Z043_117029 [Scleropages formosus]